MVESVAVVVAAAVAAEAAAAVGEDTAVAFDAYSASWPGATSLRLALAVPCVAGVAEESCSEIAVVGAVADVAVDDD